MGLKCSGGRHLTVASLTTADFFRDISPNIQNSDEDKTNIRIEIINKDNNPKRSHRQR